MPYTNSFTELVDPGSQSPVDDYILALPMERGRAFARVAEAVRDEVPEVTQGVTYCMPTFFYRGKPLVCLLSAKAHLSYFPHRGRIVDKVAEDLPGFSLATGTVRFTPDHSIPDKVVRKMVRIRAAEIDAAIACRATSPKA